jgi:hypothetical protein
VTNQIERWSTRNRWMAVTIGIAVATMGAFVSWTLWPRPSVGLSFYQVFTSSPVWHQRLMAGPPRSIFLASPKENHAGVRVNLPDYSFNVLPIPWCIGFDWSGADPVIRSVSFSPEGSGIADDAKGTAVFVRSHPAYTFNYHEAPPLGILEIVDAHRKGFFSVPAACRAIAIYAMPRKPVVRLSGIHIFYPRFELDWAPASGFTNPRGYLEFAAGLRGPETHSHSNLCERSLASVGISSSEATRIIHATVSRHLSTLTDLQIVRQSLKVTGTDIERTSSVGKAIWLTLLLDLSDFRNGPAVWVHLQNGRRLYFASGRFGERALLFNAAGRAISAGAVGYANSQRWTWPRRLQILRTVAIPFFSQPPPPGFAQRRKAR